MEPPESLMNSDTTLLQVDYLQASGTGLGRSPQAVDAPGTVFRSEKEEKAIRMTGATFEDLRPGPFSEH